MARREYVVRSYFGGRAIGTLLFCELKEMTMNLWINVLSDYRRLLASVNFVAIYASALGIL